MSLREGDVKRAFGYLRVKTQAYGDLSLQEQRIAVRSHFKDRLQSQGFAW